MIESSVRRAPAPKHRFVDMGIARGDVRRDVLAGLRATPKRISPRFFYDEAGSRLFECITQTPEYYPTRIELDLLHRHGPAIAAALGAGTVLIEPGAGSCTKVRRLLPHLRPRHYVPMDISGEFLFGEADALAREFPELDVLAIRTDMTRLDDLPQDVPAERRMVFYPGSTLGNLDADDALRFLRTLRRWVGDDGGALIGIDQHKDRAVLERAYNDAAGHTAAFNLNVLAHLNRIMPADFDLDAFRHRAFYNERERRIEMHLESVRHQRVRCAGHVITLAAGERIHTENSYKYTPERFLRLVARAGFEAVQSWRDDRDWFRLWHLRANRV